MNADPHAVTLLFGTHRRGAGEGVVTKRGPQAGGNGVFRTNTGRLVFLAFQGARITLGVKHVQHNLHIVRCVEADFQFLAGLLVLCARIGLGFLGGLDQRPAKRTGVQLDTELTIGIFGLCIILGSCA